MERFGLSEEEAALAAMVREFADEVVAPQSYAADRSGTLNLEVVRAMGELGLFGLPFPEEHGGQGGNYLALCIALEELGRVDQSIAITLEAGVSLGAMPIYLFGTEQQKQEHLPDLLQPPRSPASDSPKQKQAAMPAQPAPPLALRVIAG